MPDTDRLAARLDAVERALTDGDHDLDGLPDAADLSDRLADLESRLGELESRQAELDAAVRALRGYVGNLDAVNEAVERRADAALAAADGTAHRRDGDPADDPDSERRTGRPDPDSSDPAPQFEGVPDDCPGERLDDGWRDAAAPAADPVDPAPDSHASEPGERWLDRHDDATAADAFGVRPDDEDSGPPPGEVVTDTESGGRADGGDGRATGAKPSLLDRVREVL